MYTNLPTSFLLFVSYWSSYGIPVWISGGCLFGLVEYNLHVNMNDACFAFIFRTESASYYFYSQHSAIQKNTVLAYLHVTYRNTGSFFTVEASVFSRNVIFSKKSN